MAEPLFVISVFKARFNIIIFFSRKIYAMTEMLGHINLLL